MWEIYLIPGLIILTGFITLVLTVAVGTMFADV